MATFTDLFLALLKKMINSHLLGHGLGDGVDGRGETLPPVFAFIVAMDRHGR